MSRAIGIVHVFNQRGHRGAYQQFLVQLLGFEPDVGRLDLRRLRKLVLGKRLLFATISRGVSTQVLIVAVLRGLLWRRTCAICMGEDWYRYPGRPLANRIRIVVYRVLTKLGLLHVFGIMPWRLSPGLRRSTVGWIYDLQLWDLSESQRSLAFEETALARLAKERAGSRRIVLFLGKADLRKSYDHFVQLALTMADRYFFVSAGPLTECCSELATRLRDAGMLVEDRYLEEPELLSLYGVGDYVWCRYSETSDVSSGVFGRALQLGRTAIVRQGSYLDRLSEYLERPVVYDLDSSVVAAPRPAPGALPDDAEGRPSPAKEDPCLAMATYSTKVLRSALRLGDD